MANCPKHGAGVPEHKGQCFYCAEYRLFAPAPPAKQPAPEHADIPYIIAKG